MMTQRKVIAVVDLEINGLCVCMCWGFCIVCILKFKQQFKTVFGCVQEMTEACGCN